ncbi:hypothetical protein, partial [Pseudomonas sp. NBRC 111142]|uniref:hypothetical protein n=1 Tax=Pseudomonas sp. NBRC 111142 TaxID=1661057 RepID=UPI000AF1B00E
LVESDEETVTLKDSKAVIERKSLNGFVYCMSLVRKSRDCIGIFPEYDDAWFLPESRALNFGVLLGGMLHNAIIAGRASGRHLVPENLNLESLSVNLEAGPVEYQEREIHVINSNTFKLEEFQSRMARIAFTKPPIPFAKEKEYRFNYTIVSENRIIEPLVKFAILDASPLQKLILHIDTRNS